MTFAEDWQKYWIPKGKQVIKKLLKQCIDRATRNSIVIKGTVNSPLPDITVKPARPFAVTGCDFTAPLYLQRNEKTHCFLYMWSHKSHSFRNEKRHDSCRV